MVLRIVKHVRLERLPISQLLLADHTVNVNVKLGSIRLLDWHRAHHVHRISIKILWVQQHALNVQQT